MVHAETDIGSAKLFVEHVKLNTAPARTSLSVPAVTWLQSGPR